MQICYCIAAKKCRWGAALAGLSFILFAYRLTLCPLHLILRPPLDVVTPKHQDRFNAIS